MLHPSYADLIEVVNSGVEEGEEPIVNSRYSIVLAAAKRARQIISEKKQQESTTSASNKGKGKKPLSIAVEEIYEGKVKIFGGNEESEE